MMASDFAPAPLNPVGYGTTELHRLLIDFRIQAFASWRLLLAPYPSHYAGRWATATMPSADFCLITDKVTLVGAIGLYLFRSTEAIHSMEPRHL